MVCGRDVLLDAQRAAEFLNEFGGEPRVSVAYDFVWQSVASDDDFEEYSRGLFCRDGFIAGCEVCHFRAALVGDREY